MVSITLNVEVECDRCGLTLKSKFDGETLSVEPCEACMEEQWDRGYIEGKNDLAEMETKKVEEATYGTPMFAHDCESCIFLGGGSLEGDREVWYDYYYCGQGGRPTVIARYSSDGPDYLSGMDNVPTTPPLQEAYRRAKNAGLIK